MVSSFRAMAMAASMAQSQQQLQNDSFVSAYKELLGRQQQQQQQLQQRRSMEDMLKKLQGKEDDR